MWSANSEQFGFRGGVNYYRNFHRNWEISQDYASDRVTVPTVFIAGSRDVVSRRRQCRATDWFDVTGD